MKIAIFSDSYFPGIGGTEKATFGLANALNGDNEVVVCCPSYHKKEQDSPFRVFRTKSFRITSNDFVALPGISFKFKKQLREFAPDIIHCQSVSPMTRYALKFGKKFNIPVIMTVHTKFRTSFARSIKSKVIVDCIIKDIAKKLKKSSKVFTVSSDMIPELNSYGYNGEITVVRNGATFERINNLDEIKNLAIEKYNLQKEKNIFLYVGHIVKFKNLEFTLDALKIVKEKEPNFKMIFVGRGFDDEYFKNYAAKIGLSDNVIFTGEITDKLLLSSLFAVAQLYLFPSIFDNDPLTVVEAALHKVPAVTLKGTGSSERIEDGVSGFIVENDRNVYANKIIELIQNKDFVKKVGENAEKLIPKEWFKTAKEYLVEYNNLINEKQRSSQTEAKSMVVAKGRKAWD